MGHEGDPDILSCRFMYTRVAGADGTDSSPDLHGCGPHHASHSPVVMGTPCRVPNIALDVPPRQNALAFRLRRGYRTSKHACSASNPGGSSMARPAEYVGNVKPARGSSRHTFHLGIKCTRVEVRH